MTGTVPGTEDKNSGTVGSIFCTLRNTQKIRFFFQPTRLGGILRVLSKD